MSPTKQGREGAGGGEGQQQRKEGREVISTRPKGLSPPSCLGSTARCRGRRWLGVGGSSCSLCPLCSELIEEQRSPHTASVSPFPGPGIQTGL